MAKTKAVTATKATKAAKTTKTIGAATGKKVARTKLDAATKTTALAKKPGGSSKRPPKDVDRKSAFGGVKKPYRLHPGTKTKRDIRSWTSGKNRLKPCTQRQPFERLVREIVDEEGGEAGGKRLEGRMVDALRETTEALAVRFFEKAGPINALRKRVTIDGQALMLGAKSVVTEHFFDSLEPRVAPDPAVVAAAEARRAAFDEKRSQKKEKAGAGTGQKRAVKKPVNKQQHDEESSTSDNSSTSGEEAVDGEEMNVENSATSGVPLPPLMDVEAGGDGETTD